MPPRIMRAALSEPDAADDQALSIALALLGAGVLPPAMLAETAVWDRTDAPCTLGRAAISGALDALPAPEEVELLEVVTHGKAGTVSGRVRRAGAGPALFCHVIRYATPARRQIAQLVSFERLERPKRPATRRQAGP